MWKRVNLQAAMEAGKTLVDWNWNKKWRNEERIEEEIWWAGSG